MTLAEIINGTRANNCVECGKCSAACSMPSMYADFSLAFSPRGLVQNTLRRALGLGKEPESEWLKRCLQCGNCTRTCPEGVDCAGLIAALREDALLAGEGGFRFCPRCGREIMAEPVGRWLENFEDGDAGSEYLPDFLKKFVGEEASEPVDADYRDLCAVCRRQAYAANNG